MSIHGKLVADLVTVASLAARQHYSDSEKTLPLDILIVRDQEEQPSDWVGWYVKDFNYEKLLFAYFCHGAMVS